VQSPVTAPVTSKPNVTPDDRLIKRSSNGIVRNPLQARRSAPGPGVRVVPLPAARYHSATNEILVAWSEGETDLGSRGNIRLARVSADANMNVTPVTLSSAIVGTNVDEFTPVIETDGTGTVMLAYYDRRGMSGSNYQLRVAKLTSNGSLVTPVFPDTNPTPLGSPCIADFVGEYQGLWRGSYPGGFQYDLAWTCSDASSNRTIQRGGVR